MTIGMREQVVGYVGVPPSQMRPGSRFPLQVRARITGLAGFPLQSLTRMVSVEAMCWIFELVFWSDRSPQCVSYRSNT